jgi:F-type H+-transporting ATPase subunit epsilon
MANSTPPLLQLEVLTPKGQVLSMAADEVTAPGIQGEFGVLPGHLPLLVALRTGILAAHGGGETKQIAIGPGFAEVTEGKLLVLTDDTMERTGVDPVQVRKTLGDVQNEMRSLATESGTLDEQKISTRMRDLVAQENWLAAQLELYGDPPLAAMRPHQQYGPPSDPPEEDT